MFNLEEMRQLAQGALFAPDATWVNARADGRSAFQMAKTLTIPLVLISAVVGLVLGLIFTRNQSLYYITSHFVANLALGVLGVFVLAFLADFFAGFFGGARDYDSAFNAAALTAVPSAVGSALLPIPYLGQVASLGLWLYGLYLLYRALPVFLTIPAEKRVVHFIATLASAMVIGFLLAMASTL